MATLRQLAANRKNALASTGPKSHEGKAASCQNALKHGLAGDGEVIAERDADPVARRLDEWRPGFNPATAEEEWLFEQMVGNSVRLDRCQDEEQALRM
jgi:hypothetical protein